MPDENMAGLAGRKPMPTPITNEAEIEVLVRDFYKHVRADETLGPIFARVIGEDWEPHLQKMFAFWSPVMLMSGRYKGAPMVGHMRPEASAPGNISTVGLLCLKKHQSEIGRPTPASDFSEKHGGSPKALSRHVLQSG